MKLNLRELQRTEAEKIYGSIFGRKIPHIIRERFIAVSEVRLNHTVPEETLKAYYRIIQQVEDMEALEVAARYLNKLSFLSLKFQLMVYLAETLPENHRFFYADKKGYPQAGYFIILGFFATLYKLFKGWLLVRKI